MISSKEHLKLLVDDKSYHRQMFGDLRKEMKLSQANTLVKNVFVNVFDRLIFYPLSASSKRLKETHPVINRS